MSSTSIGIILRGRIRIPPTQFITPWDSMNRFDRIFLSTISVMMPASAFTAEIRSSVPFRSSMFAPCPRSSFESSVTCTPHKTFGSRTAASSRVAVARIFSIPSVFLIRSLSPSGASLPCTAKGTEYNPLRMSSKSQGSASAPYVDEKLSPLSPLTTTRPCLPKLDLGTCSIPM